MGPCNYIVTTTKTVGKTGVGKGKPIAKLVTTKCGCQQLVKQGLNDYTCGGCGHHYTYH